MTNPNNNPSPQLQQQQQHQYHNFFLFRHCLRSTNDKFKVTDRAETDINDDVGTTSESEYDTEQPMPSHPEWNVPHYWCTEVGMEITRKMGRYLLEEILLPDSRMETDQFHVQIIMDESSQRDVDTAWALSQGMQDVVHNGINVNVTGLHQIYGEKYLFRQPAFVQESPPYTSEQQYQAVRKRLEFLPEPPDFPLRIAFKVIADIMPELNTVNSSYYMPYEAKISTTTNQMNGAVSFAKLFAQMLFYSLASNVNFLTNETKSIASMEVTYQLMQYIHWARSVEYVGTPAAACTGAVHAVSLLTTLINGSYYPINDDSISNSNTNRNTNDRHLPTPHPHHRATILVGHDSDLDALATILDAHWMLKSPYRSGPNGYYQPTPPLSGIHARLDQISGIIEINFLYPVYSIYADGRTTWDTNVSGILETAALRGTPFPLIRNDTAIRIPNINALQQHMERTIETYPGADLCYRAAWDFHTEQQQLHSTRNNDFPILGKSSLWTEPGPMLSIGVLFGIVLTIASCWISRKREPCLRYNVVDNSENVPPRSDVELT